MFGKIRKTLKKVAKADPVARKTSKVLRKTGGPAGKAISKAMTGGVSRKTAVPVTSTTSSVRTGGNAPKTRVPGVSMSTPSPKTRMKTPSTVGGSTFNKTAGSSLRRLGRRSGMARH